MLIARNYAIAEARDDLPGSSNHIHNNGYRNRHGLAARPGKGAYPSPAAQQRKRAVTGRTATKTATAGMEPWLVLQSYLAMGQKLTQYGRTVPTAPRARHTFGMGLLGLVVVLWVSSSFLTHAIFADDSYSKPYLLTYITTATFCLYLLPSSIRWLLQQHKSPAVAYAPVPRDEGEEEAQKYHGAAQDKLSTRETMRLSAEFCLLWFIVCLYASHVTLKQLSDLLQGELFRLVLLKVYVCCIYYNTLIHI